MYNFMQSLLLWKYWGEKAEISSSKNRWNRVINQDRRKAVHISTSFFYLSINWNHRFIYQTNWIINKACRAYRRRKIDISTNILFRSQNHNKALSLNYVLSIRLYSLSCFQIGVVNFCTLNSEKVTAEKLQNY